jgi:osmotically-inducible protein OsmY
MAQDRDYRHWEDDSRGRRSQGEGEGFRSGETGYGGGRMESGFGDRGSNRYGGREEWRASAFGPRQDDGWRSRDEDRWGRAWGGGERERSDWGSASGDDWSDRSSWRGSGGGLGYGGMGSDMGSDMNSDMNSNLDPSGDWPERDRWRSRGQGQYFNSGIGARRSSSDYRGSSGRGSYGPGPSGNRFGRPGSQGERQGERQGELYAERGFWDRASDEVQSWFGDEEAQHRRAHDQERDYRGRGPRGYVRSDERIREDVCDRLEQDRRIDASEIEVTVAGGEVRLDGYVDSRMARRRAEDCAEMISGVRHVQNNLRVHEYSAATAGQSAKGETGAASSGQISSSTRTAGSSSGTGASGQTGSSSQK